MFNHEESSVINAVRDLTSTVFEHLEITYIMDVYKRLSYTKLILRVSVIKKYKAVMMECKHPSKDNTGDKWDLGALKELSTDDFCIWAKKYRIWYDGNAYLGLDKRVEFDKDLWLELGKCMLRKYQSV